MRTLFTIVVALIISHGLNAQTPEVWYFEIEKRAAADIHVALDLADSAAVLFPKNLHFEKQRIGLLYQASDYEQLLKLSSAPGLRNIPEIARYSALAAARLGDYALWKQWYTHYLNLPGVYQDDEENAGFDFVQHGAPEVWLEFWKSFHPNPEKKRLCTARKMIDQAKCFEAYMLLNDSSRHNSEELQLMSEALMCMGDTHAALRILSKAVKKYPDDAKLRYLHAIVLSKMGRPAQSFASFLIYMKQEPFSTTVWLMAAVEANNCNKFNEAIGLYQQYMKFVGNIDNAVRYQYAQVLINAGDLAAALSVLDQLIEADAASVAVRVDRAGVRYRLKHYGDAFADYMMALDVSPSNGEAWFNAGWCAYQLNNTEKACTCWQKALHNKFPDAEAPLERYCK